MAQEFLGAGWSYPLQFDERGRLVLVREEDAVRRSMWLVLATALGERAMRPDFGCGLHDLVFSSASTELYGRISEAVRRAITQWEPRVALQRVAVLPDAQDPDRLTIEIQVQILATDSPFNLVYPFYLGGDADD
jgi:hypothetical protein